jgi:hypothetical protein
VIEAEQVRLRVLPVSVEIGADLADLAIALDPVLEPPPVIESRFYSHGRRSGQPPFVVRVTAPNGAA